MTATWYCCRQRAGPLVKECRALRPRFSQNDTGQDARSKAQLRSFQRCAVNRREVDRVELLLALLGWEGVHYTLTFDDEHLPDSFKGVRERTAAFLKRLRRFLPPEIPLDYLYRIEGLHGEHRYHIHFCADGRWIRPTMIRMLWRDGIVDDEPVFRLRSYLDPDTGEPVEISDGGFRRLAEYFCKERVDGETVPLGRHPLSVSRSLRQRLPAPERWTCSSGITAVPDDSVWVRRNGTANDFGAFYFTAYIAPDDSKEYARACARARARQSLK